MTAPLNQQPKRGKGVKSKRRKSLSVGETILRRMIREQKEQGVYDTGLGWAARQAVADVYRL